MASGVDYRKLFGITAVIKAFSLARFFYNYGRSNGFITASVKAYKQIVWGRGDRYVSHHRARLQKMVGESTATSAISLFKQHRVVIVAEMSLPQCRKYRVLQKYELLKKLGYGAKYYSWQDVPAVLAGLQCASHLLLYRAPDQDITRQYLAEAKRLGLKVFYDIDDPIFDRDIYAANRNLDMLSSAEKGQLLASTESYRSLMADCDGVIVSTSGMASAAAIHFPRSVLWPNLIDQETMACATSVSVVDKNPERIVLGYMSGSRAHENDFRIIENTLLELLAAYPNVDLQICGFLNLPESFNPYQDRIRMKTFSSYQHYFDALSGVDVNLIPLLDDQFNHCKSAIRYFEASLMKVPTVASAVGQFSEVIKQGENGYCAATSEQWLSIIEKLIDSASLIDTIGNYAYEYVIKSHSIESWSENFDNTIKPFMELEL